MYLFYDFTGYGLVVLGALITIVAQIFINTRYNKFKNIKTSKGLSGVEVARLILDKNGLQEVYVTETKGVLSDHYDPARKVVRLSSEVFHSTSIASVAVAAHECGHAIQNKEGYFFIKLRSFLVPFVNFSSILGYIAIMIGLLLSWLDLAWLGIGLLLMILLFQLVTLPTELDASKRALQFLEEEQILTSSELDGGKSMLRAAAFTYVASLASTLLEILHLVMIVSGRDDN